MTKAEQQKETCVNTIMWHLSKVYAQDHKINQKIRRALLKKFSIPELNALYALVLTSVKK